MNFFNFLGFSEFSPALANFITSKRNFYQHDNPTASTTTSKSTTTSEAMFWYRQAGELKNQNMVRYKLHLSNQLTQKKQKAKKNTLNLCHKTAGSSLVKTYGELARQVSR